MKQEVSLCERVIRFRSWTTHLFARHQCYLRGAAFLRFDEDRFPHVVHVLGDGEEGAQVVCRLDQLANDADGLRARVDMDVVFYPFLSKGDLLEDGVIP